MFLLKNHFDGNGNNDKSRENEYDCRLHRLDFSRKIWFSFESFNSKDEMAECHSLIAGIFLSIFQRGLIDNISFSFSLIIPREIKQYLLLLSPC